MTGRLAGPREQAGPDRGQPLVTAPLEQLAEDLLAGTAAVVDSGIDDVAAGVRVGVEDSPAFLRRGADTTLLAEGHRAQDQFREP
jgi:hypothetical protein